MFTVKELTTPVTREQWELSIYDTLAALGVGTTNWKPGAVVRAIVTAFAVMLAALSSLVSSIAGSAFLSTTSADWLDLVASEVYGVTRFPATFATGLVTVTNSGGGVYSFAAGDLVFLNSSTGKSYKNLSAASIGAGATVDVSVIALEEGAASSAIAGAIDAFETPYLGLTCTNALELNGTDAESDPALEARALESLGALSANGPKDAYSYAAKTAKRQDGSLIGVTRVRTVRDAYGGVSVYCANATGGITGTYTDPSTDLGAIQAAIISDCEPLSVTATTVSATPVTVNVTYQMWVYNDSGVTAAEAAALVADKLGAWFEVRPIGGDVIGAAGYVWKEQIVAEIGSAVEGCFRVNLTSPVADVAIDPSEVPVLGTITPTVTLVAKGSL